MWSADVLCAALCAKQMIKPFFNCKKIMQTKITITNSSQTCFIDIEGTIGVEHTDNPTTSVATYEAFRREVERIASVAAQRVVVNIRSTGGDVQDALLIYDALRALDAHVTTRCYGYTASAATIIAQAADEGAREISSNAMYLIHRSMCAIEGNAQSLLSRAELLRKTDERLAQLYAQHSHRSVEEYAALMAENNGEGRWLTAEEAVEAGLADRIIEGIATGVELPDTVSEQGGALEQVTPSAVADPNAAPAPAATPSPSAPAVPKEVKRAVGRAAGELLRYLFNRFAYRWEQWMESMQLKREERTKERKQRAAEKSAEKSAEGQHSAIEDAIDSSPQVQAAAQSIESQAMRRSVVAFDSGQRSYQATALKQVDDPSLNQPHIGSNTQAYSDDVKAFCR